MQYFKSLFLFSVLFFTINIAKAQNQDYTIKGTAQDTSTFMFVTNSSIMVITESDSILQSFTRAKEDGSFSLNVKEPGNYILMISHPSFATKVQEIKITDRITDLGTIEMVSKRVLLEDVVISGESAITIKGDTIEYAADSFRVREFDNVDELLKRLPGLEVSKDGSITAYGEKVQKMFVDGEEFFSDDPAVLAKTLRASAIDKVQVYDGKTEQAEFTGVDDGERIKTINLKLKEEAKKGYMGKVSGGYAPKTIYEGEAMLNSFKKKRKFSIYSIGANTNKIGLGWQDARTFGGNDRSGGFTQDEDGVWVSNNSNMDEFSTPYFSGEGLPRTFNAGIYYANKWKEDKYSLNGGYRYINNGNNNINNSITQFILPDTQYFDYKNAESKKMQQRHNVNARTEVAFDSLTTLRINATGSYGTINSSTTTNTRAQDISGELINRTSRVQESENEYKNFNTNIDFRKRFKKPGRTFTASVSGGFRDNNGNANLNSTNELFAIGTVLNIDQTNITNSNSNNFNTKFTFTEALWKEQLFWETNYGFSTNNSRSENATYDILPGSEEGVYNNFFSSDYQFNILTNRGGTALRYVKNKIITSIGGDVSYANFHQTDLRVDTNFAYDRLNFFPRASFTFKRNKQSTVNIRYNGATAQPTLEQIQPRANNIDPMNIYIGNPDLKQQFMHNVSLNYNSYAVLKNRYVFSSVNYSIIQNAISQSQMVDEAGRRTYQNVNVNGNQNLNFFAGASQQVMEGFRVSIFGSGNYFINNNYVNSIKNKNTQFTATPSLGAEYNKDTVGFISFRFSPTYNVSNNSIRNDVSIKYWTFRQDINIERQLPYGFRIGTEVAWNIRQRVDKNEANNNVFHWNAFVSKTLLKDRSLEAKIYANDILNQNVGFRRMQSADMINENTYNVIRRYVMFSLTWNFTQTGATKGNTSGRSSGSHGVRRVRIG